MDDTKLSSDNIESIKEELEKLKSIFSGYDVKAEKETREVSKIYNKIIETIEDTEIKNYSLITEYNDLAGYGAWDEEQKAYIDKTILKSLFQDEGWIYVIVDLIASKICACPLKVYQKIAKENGKEEIEEASDHPFNKVIESPNPFQDYYDWMYCIVADLTLVGDAFLYGPFGSDNLYHMPTETMALKFNSNGELSGFDRFASNFDGTREFIKSFTIEEIIHIRRPNPSSFYQGFSAFIPGRKSVLFNKYSLEYLNNYYLKGASSGMVLEISKETNEANAKRLLKSFELAYLGRKNQRRVKVLPAGVTAKQFGESLADQQLKDYLTQNKEDILALLKVPKHEVGLQTAGSLGSEEYKQALKNFWEATLKPSMGLVKGKLNKKLKSKLGETYFLDFDLSEVEVLKENEIQKGQIADGLLKTHTINEVREKLYSMPPVDGGDVILSLQKPETPSFFGMNQNDNTNLEDEEIKEEQPLIVIPEQKIELFTDQADNLIKASGNWFEQRKQKIEATTKDQIIDITKMFVDLFADQAVSVIKELPKMVRKAVDLRDEEQVKKVINRAIADQVKSIKDELWMKEKEQIDEYVKMTFDHPSYASDSKIINDITKASKKDAEKFIKERNDYIFELLNRTTSDDIYRLIDKASKNSSTLMQLAQAISKKYNEEGMLWRGERIARTEVLTILSKTQDIAAKKAAEKIPGLKKMWISTFDARTRGNPTGLYKDSNADHWHLHGQIRNENDPFEDPRNKDRLMFPRDPNGKAESVINCRCTYIILPSKEMDKFRREEREAKPNA